VSDDEDIGLPNGADHLVPVGDIGADGVEHAIAVKDGEPVALMHVRQVHDGQPIAPGSTVHYIEADTGKVVDSIRLAGGSGPAQVATKKYRDNHEAIFGRKKKQEELN
jgi:hypothetical protein